VANLVTEKAYYDIGKDRADLPDDMAETIEEARLELIEAAAEADDALMEKYFEDEKVEAQSLKDYFMANKRFIPVGFEFEVK